MNSNNFFHACQHMGAPLVAVLDSPENQAWLWNPLAPQFPGTLVENIPEPYRPLSIVEDGLIYALQMGNWEGVGVLAQAVLRRGHMPGFLIQELQEYEIAFRLSNDIQNMRWNERYCLFLGQYVGLLTQPQRDTFYELAQLHISTVGMRFLNEAVVAHEKHTLMACIDNGRESEQKKI